MKLSNVKTSSHITVAATCGSSLPDNNYRLQIIRQAAKLSLG